jgi:hypothetical protein
VVPEVLVSTDQFAGVYRFGTIRAASPVPLVQLPLDDGPPDVVIRLVPELRTLPALEWSASWPSDEAPEETIGLVRDEIWLLRPGLMAAKLDLSARSITVHTALRPTSETLAHVIGDYAVPHYLGCQGTLVLHGSAVARQGRAVAIVGESGAGKSTLAARLVHRGFDIMADDATVIDPLRPPTLVATSQLSRLLADTVGLLNIPEEHVGGLVASEGTKRYVSHDGPAVEPASLTAMLLLHPSSDFGKGPTPMKLADATEQLVWLSYGLLAPHSHRDVFLRAAELAACVPMQAVGRPQEDHEVDDLVNYLEHHYRL